MRIPVLGRGWVQAADLILGDRVRQIDGEFGAVEAIQVERRTLRMYNLTVAVAHTFFVGEEAWLVHNHCHTNLVDGMHLPINDALQAADHFLGPGSRSMGGGRQVSSDGLRQVRMGDGDILGEHGGGAHMNFETLAPMKGRPGRMEIIDNKHIYLVP